MLSALHAVPVAAELGQAEAACIVLLSSGDACKQGIGQQEGTRYWLTELTCIVRMSNRPKKSFTDTSSSNTVLYMSAEVPAERDSTWHRQIVCKRALTTTRAVAMQI